MLVRKQALKAKEAARVVANLSTAQKNNALKAIVKELNSNSEIILKANEKDISSAKKAGMTTMIDRLELNMARIKAIIADIENVISLPDPVGKILEEKGQRLALIFKELVAQ